MQAVVAVGLAAAGRDRSDAAQPGEGCFGVQTLRVVTDADQQRGSGVGSDTEGLEQVGGDLADQGGASGVEFFEFGVEVLHSAGQDP